MMEDDELVIFEERVNNGDLMFLEPNFNSKCRPLTTRASGITRSLGTLLAERVYEDPNLDKNQI